MNENLQKRLTNNQGQFRLRLSDIPSQPTDIFEKVDKEMQQERGVLCQAYHDDSALLANQVVGCEAIPDYLLTPQSS